MQPAPERLGPASSEERGARRLALRVLQEQGFEPMVGGACALREHTGIWRDTKVLLLAGDLTDHGTPEEATWLAEALSQIKMEKCAVLVNTTTSRARNRLCARSSPTQASTCSTANHGRSMVALPVLRRLEKSLGYLTLDL